MKTNEQYLQSVLTANGFDITVEQVRTILDEVVELAATTGTSLQDAYEWGEMFWEEEYAGPE
jgi:molybdopterin-biosynthesis enzyme MoeA-like protein